VTLTNVDSALRSEGLCRRRQRFSRPAKYPNRGVLASILAQYFFEEFPCFVAYLAVGTG
jgi:hypothetical protein